MPVSAGPVLVTGGSGYVGSWVVRSFLEDGCRVRATVRSLAKEEKVQHLKKLQADHPGQLELFEADLLQDGSFAAAMEGCEVVCHTASPFQMDVKDAMADLVEPALKGTRNVLLEANKHASVRRVVVTSSVAAVYGDNRELHASGKKHFSEEDWNTTSTVKSGPYPYSKTVAEREAWKIAEAQDRWTLAVINPSFVLGPSLSDRVDGFSTNFMMDLYNGKYASGCLNLEMGCVDVRDVGKAHVLAAKPEAKGRHVLAENVYPMLEIASRMRAEAGDRKYNLPGRVLPKFLVILLAPFLGLSMWYLYANVNYPLAFDNTKSKEKLGLAYTPFNKTLRDHEEQLRGAGLIKPAQ